MFLQTAQIAVINAQLVILILQTVSHVKEIEAQVLMLYLLHVVLVNKVKNSIFYF